jgi:quinol monooxygenase YgiN
MDRLAVLAQLEAKPGKELEVEQFLKSALPLVQAEAGTTTWYALKMGPSKFGIFDTFADEKGRNAHLSGEVAQALFAKAEELFARAPAIEQPEILAVKAPGAHGELN